MPASAGRLARHQSAAALAATVLAATVLTLARPAVADDAGRLTILEENDFFTPDNRDRHYTQGAELHYLSPDLAPGGIAAPFDWLSMALPVFAPGAQSTSRHFDLFAGQQIFTPQNKGLLDPLLSDRPYAGWLYGGVALIQDTDQRQLEHLELLFGMVGPSSLAAQTQNRFHLAIDQPNSQGWSFQLHDEPTGNVYYDRHWRFIADLDDTLSADIIPEAGAAAGNAYDYLAAGFVARFGKNLRVDYGPPLIGPGPSGTTYFNRDDYRPGTLWGWYAFVGSEGRAVARNIFLDGNSYQPSRSVRKRPLVGDLETGAALVYSDWARISYTYLSRSDEFYGQHNADNFGALMFSVRLAF